MVKVALKRDRNIERTITKVSYDLNKKAYILLEGDVKAPVKKSESPAAAESKAVVEQAIQEEAKSKGGRPRKTQVNEG